MALKSYLLKPQKFDLAFWMQILEELGYPNHVLELDVETLEEIFPRTLPVEKVLRFFVNDYVEGAIIIVSGSITRSVATKIARNWKKRRLIRPLLIFTCDQGDRSFVVTVPGPGTGGEARVLDVSERLYHTDIEALEMMRFEQDQERFRERYDTEFLPYERVRKEFFEGYRALYEKIEGAIKPIFEKAGIPSESSAYAQRFLGRLMFIYFIQKKGWISDNTHYIDTVKNIEELNLLFYDGFNRKDSPLGVPYLNGSLFEKEEYMDKLQGELEKVMEPLFFEARDFYDKYNFTVDESSPMDVSVSLDPSMIGTVFENMLPENERGAKGTYYTPPAEISFIVRRAIAQYLGLEDRVDSNQNGKTFVDAIDRLLEEIRAKKDIAKVRWLRDRLLNARILDPAVGSGGFLVAAMEEIVNILQEAESAVGFQPDIEDYKQRILPNLYGFDIEKEAVEVARLRLWLSLVVVKKQPEPLPNLDLNIVQIEDSLIEPPKYWPLDQDVKIKIEHLQYLREKYVNQHDPQEKQRIRGEFKNISEEIKRKTGQQYDTIEFYIANPDIIVMNPPYVRQEKISQAKKQYYSGIYGLDKKSDLYAYFIVRALNLLKEGGALAAISSDKWLEAGYGEKLQEKIKPFLIAVYGQKHRSFGADINTVITVYTKTTTPPQQIKFIYMESYANTPVKRAIYVNRKELKPGKWFYLRAPQVFIEKILPKLTHRLEEYAEIKRGFTTGANEFFYLRDVSHLFEADYLANPKKFEEWGVTCKTRSELEKQGLVYVENERGERFVLEKQCVRPLLRSIKEFDRPYIDFEPQKLCFWVTSGQQLPFFASIYVKWGEGVQIQVTRGSNMKTVKGYNNLPTIRVRRPWYSLPDISGRLFLPRLFWWRFFVIRTNREYVADHMFVVAKPRSNLEDTLWKYLNSTVFFLTLEVLSKRMGAGALNAETQEYKEVLVPDLITLQNWLGVINFGSRPVLRFDEEVKQQDKRALDLAVLEGLGYDKAEAEEILEKLYEEYVEIVRDRLIKAGRSLAQRIESELEEDQGLAEEDEEG